MVDRIIQAIHTPAHWPGSMVYLTESDGLKVPFGQDVHRFYHRQKMITTGVSIPE
jgi:glyoxylase-like metal-dependent hydrolase (beta-lactamase superfamily II)